MTDMGDGGMGGGGGLPTTQTLHCLRQSLVGRCLAAKGTQSQPKNLQGCRLSYREPALCP